MQEHGSENAHPDAADRAAEFEALLTLVGSPEFTEVRSASFQELFVHFTFIDHCKYPSMQNTLPICARLI